MVENIYIGGIREIPLAELVEMHASRRPARVEDFPFAGSVPYIDIKALESAPPNRYTVVSDSLMREQDLVMVKDGYRSGKVFHAKKGVAASTLAILKPKWEGIRMDYLYCYLSYCYEDFQNRIAGMTIGHLDMKYLRNLLIPVPEVSIQKEIAEKYQRLESLINETKEKSLRLKELSELMGEKGLKAESDSLKQQVEMIQKAWLHQIFDRKV